MSPDGPLLRFVPQGSDVVTRVIVVTGSTSGIGYATAKRFCLAGNQVMLHGLDDAFGASIIGRLRNDVPDADIHLLTGDLRDPTICNDLIQSAVERFGRIDVLVNNAGAGPFIGVMETDVEQWDASIN
ncbi:MAG: SDR family NAD(P)-dependent oxidoreductase, partial [Pirellulales bacterium]